MTFRIIDYVGLGLWYIWFNIAITIIAILKTVVIFTRRNG